MRWKLHPLIPTDLESPHSVGAFALYPHQLKFLNITKRSAKGRFQAFRLCRMSQERCYVIPIILVSYALYLHRCDNLMPHKPFNI